MSSHALAIVLEKIPSLTFSSTVVGERRSEDIFPWAIQQRIQSTLDGEQGLVIESTVIFHLAAPLKEQSSGDSTGAVRCGSKTNNTRAYPQPPARPISNPEGILRRSKTHKNKLLYHQVLQYLHLLLQKVLQFLSLSL